MRYLWFVLLLFSGCGATSASSTATVPKTTSPPPFTLSADYTIQTLPHKFNQPTQFVIEPATLWVAELNGGENAEKGRVVRVDRTTNEQTIVLENLDKPTGIAVLDAFIYIATQNQLLRYNISTDEKTVLLDELPNNGRSNGTLTVTPDRKLLYETSGNRRDAASGKLWEYDLTTGESRSVASGLKGGYAHLVDGIGRLWITEIADGTLDGATLPDELNLVVEGADFGWPRCYGRELTGACDGVRPAVVTFVPHSTPTGIAVSPFAEETLLVALWVTGEVVSVSIQMVGDNAVGEIEPFITDMQNPQHLVGSADGVYVSDFATGEIYFISVAAK